jgi:TolB protein
VSPAKLKNTFIPLCCFLVFIALHPGMGTAQQGPPPAREFHAGYPAVSPDGKRIAYVSKRDGTETLYLSASDSSGEMRLSETLKPGTPAWSADGRHILFAAMDKDVSHLYSVDSDGKNQHEIAGVPGRGPILSPDGKHLIYMAGTWTETQLMVANADGSDARMINDGKSPAWNNHWSPDGKRIAFTSRTAPRAPLSVFIMNADGTDRRQVTHISADEGSAQWPVWSPDGRKLVIQVSGKDHLAHIWVVDAMTGEGTKLAAHTEPWVDETPFWFPDGRRIAFQSDRTGRMEVWTMNADGSNLRQFTR